MGLRRKLQVWQAAGLITAEQGLAIEQHESERRRPTLAYALGGLGAATIGLGILSIIAANWAAVGMGVKLAAVGLLLAVLGAALAWTRSEGRGLGSELLVVLLYGSTLGGLSLIGQITHDGELWQLLGVWTLATLPAVLLGRSRFVGALLFFGLLVTWGSVLEPLFDSLSGDLEATVGVGVLWGSPLLFLGLARIPGLSRGRSALVHTFSELTWAAAFVGGFTVPFIWYESGSSDAFGGAVAVTAALTGLWIAALPKLLPGAPSRALAGLRVALILTWVTLAVGSLTFGGREDLPVIGALTHVFYLGALAWAAAGLGRGSLFRALTAVIAVRVLIMYFEVFGSMLNTGLGMITGGLLTVALAWVWHRKSGQLASAAVGDEA